MKTKTRQSKKFKAIKTLLENRTGGLQPIPGCRKNLKTVNFPVEDHEDYMMRVAALIEVSILALDGQGCFTSKNLSHISGEASVSLVLELVLELLPHDQMFCMDRIAEIMTRDEENNPNPENKNV